MNSWQTEQAPLLHCNIIHKHWCIFVGGFAWQSLSQLQMASQTLLTESIGGQRRIKSNVRTLQGLTIWAGVPSLADLPISQLTYSRNTVQTNIIDALKLTSFSNNLNH